MSGSVVGTIDVLQGNGNVRIIRSTGETVVAQAGDTIFENDTIDAFDGTLLMDANPAFYGTDGVVSFPSGTAQRLDASFNSFVSANLAGTTSASPLVACFCEGTMVATPEGERPVESLAAGDMVRTQDGRDVAVRFVGVQTVFTRFNPTERAHVVRFLPGSLGDRLPKRDLRVTLDHAILLDGILCNAGALVNGTSITKVPLASLPLSFKVYHIETEAHDIILAEGAPAETFIDYVSRDVFDNLDQYNGDAPGLQELPFPRVTSARQLPRRIIDRLASYAAARAVA